MTRAVITDIEGTTTSVSFVFDVLFPYAREHIGEFVRTYAQAPSVRAELKAVAREAGRPLSDDEAIAELEAWIDQDRKSTPLKTLQGMLWKHGFEAGHFTGHVYDDAARNLTAWKARGLALYVYSSGSVQAQQLLFGHSDHGDLTPLFSGYFDTRTGHKRERDAYRKIAIEIRILPSEILFLSDIKEELDAAKSAGMQTAWLVRNQPPKPKAPHRQVNSFDQIELD